MSAKQTSGAATRTDTTGGEKFTEGERAIMLRINALEVTAGRLADRFKVLESAIRRTFEAGRDAQKKGGAR